MDQSCKGVLNTSPWYETSGRRVKGLMVVADTIIYWPQPWHITLNFPRKIGLKNTFYSVNAFFAKHLTHNNKLNK